VEELLEFAILNPTAVPQNLKEYIVSKVVAAPVPTPKAAVAWLQFVCWQVPQVRIYQKPAHCHLANP
jgi:hypothetical protein